MRACFNRWITEDHRFPFCNNNNVLSYSLFRYSLPVREKKNKRFSLFLLDCRSRYERTESKILQQIINYIPPNGRFFFILLELVPGSFSPSLWGSMSDLIAFAVDLNDLRKTVSISTVVIPSRKSDVRILIGPRLYSTVASL